MHKCPPRRGPPREAIPLFPFFGSNAFVGPWTESTTQKGQAARATTGPTSRLLDYFCSLAILASGPNPRCPETGHNIAHDFARAVPWNWIPRAQNLYTTPWAPVMMSVVPHPAHEQSFVQAMHECFTARQTKGPPCVAIPVCIPFLCGVATYGPIPVDSRAATYGPIPISSCLCRLLASPVSDPC